MNWLQTQAYNFILPMLLGPLVFLLMKFLKQISGWVDAQGATIKRTLVVAIAILVTTGMQLLGQPITCDTSALNSADCLNQITPEVLKTLLAAGTAFLMQYLKQMKPSK